MNVVLVTENVQDEAILSHALRLAGFGVNSERHLESVLAGWAERPADLMVLALRLSNQLDTVRNIRCVTIVPVILIDDAITEDQHVTLLDAGVDWVIERPYSVRLLIGYAKMLLRRSAGVTNRSLPTLRYQEIRLDPASRTVYRVEASPQRLSQLEFRLLHTLMMNRGHVLSAETLVEHVWGYTGEGDRSLVRGLVNRVRMKIEPNPNNPQYIHTVSRIGYMFGNEDG